MSVSIIHIWLGIKYYLKHCRELVWKIQHKGACREINTARGEAKCCIYLETRPRVLYFLYKRAKAVFYVVYCTLSSHWANIVVERWILHLVTLNKLGQWIHVSRRNVEQAKAYGLMAHATISERWRQIIN